MASDERAKSLGLGVWHDEGYHKAITLEELCSLLAAQGLHICTKAERDELAQLKAMREMRLEPWQVDAAVAMPEPMVDVPGLRREKKTNGK